MNWLVNWKKKGFYRSNKKNEAEVNVAVKRDSNRSLARNREGYVSSIKEKIRRDIPMLENNVPPQTK